MLKQYTIRYVVKVDGNVKFMNFDLVLSRAKSLSSVRRDYEHFCPIIVEDEKSQERIKSSLLSVRDTSWRVWMGC